MELGQILPDTLFGRALMEVASDPAYDTFLDVGTWKGGGTTLCLVRGAMNRLETKIYSVEANQQLYHEACKNWENRPACLELLWGKLTNQIMLAHQIESHPLFKKIKEHYQLWYRQDVIDVARAPIVVLPASVDVVVLDGGEFTGAGDMERALQLNPKVIALDDIYVMKNCENYDMLINSEEWALWRHGTERTGWAIFKRRAA